MRISFDLDDTLICHGGGISCEPPLPLIARLFVRDEPLRKGAHQLLRDLQTRGHEVWIYTTSARSLRWIRWWFRFHGIRLNGAVNGPRHDFCFGTASLPTKRPHAFGIQLHVDNSNGVAMEGKTHGFSVCVVEPESADWTEQVQRAIASENGTDPRTP